MGKYLDRKRFIEQKLKDALAGAAATLNAAVDASAVYTADKRRHVLNEATDSYKARTARPREAAISQEKQMFSELAQAVEDALTAPPSAEALRYLEALSMNPSVTARDIEGAAGFVSGNAAAEAALAGIAEKNGLGMTLGFGPAPPIREIQAGLEEFRTSREERILKVAQPGADFKIDDWSLDTFMPDASHKALDEAEAILERYGAK